MSFGETPNKKQKRQQLSLLSWIQRDSEEPKKIEERVNRQDEEESSLVAPAISEQANHGGEESKKESDRMRLGGDSHKSFSTGSQPNQPRNIVFPQRSFGNTKILKRSFQPSWFDKFTWLDYDENNDLAFCFTYSCAVKNNLLSSLNADPSFTQNGFCNWKHAMDAKKGFRKHETSNSHLEAVARYVSAPATAIGDVSELLSEQLVSEKMKNRKMLMMILSSVRYLARQALPLRGDWNSETMSEENSNFYQLLKLRSQENPELLNWLQRKDEKYTSPVIQNEILQALALGILREISQNIQTAVFYTIMADETADISCKEQLVVCIRWVDNDFIVHEDFIGLYPLERTTSDSIVQVLKDVLLTMHLKIENARGQCYDGAATMAGERTGVATQIKALNGKCLYTHCYGHALNLAVGDAVKSVKCIKDALETVREVGKLVKKSPQRNTRLDKIRTESQNESRGVHALCPTRWTVRGEALAAVLNNHEELMELWDWSLDTCKDTEMKARIRGVQAVMTKFDFYFGCSLGIQILQQTDNLSRALQQTSISAAQGNRIAQDVVKTLSKDRSDASFDLFWSRVLLRKNAEIPRAEDPVLPRKRRAPTRHEIGRQGTDHHPVTAKEHYRGIYFEIIDLATECITSRFNQKDFQIYENLQELLLKSVAGEPYDKELAEVVQLYGTDIDAYRLVGQLSLMEQTAKSMGFDTSKFDVNDLLKFMQSLGEDRKLLLSEISTLGKILFVMPATNAVSERSFSALKRVKTYLRSTTGDSRLNHLMVLHVHKEMNDAIDLVTTANTFVGAKERRKQTFGVFTPNDVHRAKELMNKSTQT